ncbi:FAD/NAD-P-binding domain-containing protein [Roridomyces roridus]|uniref:FAD/NAD-P-binding domain-containing protein n=1 Tax=Roridomyces roridus TaxID=1738132 RepID=A0AAD7FQ85_9AGAR|nr:FAD/NAD-P-binding domain-containing protein [Roridomyces roridus]
MTLLLLVLTAVAATAQQVPFSSPDKYTVFHHPIRRVAVVGAGPAGLQAAAKLVEHNFTVRLFDRAPSPGGNWFYTDETPVRESYPDSPADPDAYIPADLPATPRPLWDSLHTNSPSIITGLPDVPYSSDTPWILSSHTIQKHVRAYASLHNLNANDNPYLSSAPPVTSYSTRVEKREKIEADQTWRLTLRKLGRLPETNQIKAQWWTEDFDAVVVATGPYAAPHVPEIDGIRDWSRVTLDGKHSIYHSQHYRRPERYLNKTILIVGGSTSASEIARDIHPFAGKIYASIRNHREWDSSQLRTLIRFPEDTEFGIKTGGIQLKNGTVLHGIDEIILATGYRHSTLFFPEYAAGGTPTNLHWTGHWIPDPTLAYTNVRPWTIGRYQSYAFAKVWEGTAHLPTQKEMQEDYDNDTYYFRGYIGSGPSEAFYRQYVWWLNQESLVNGGRFVEPWPLENREIFAYYSNVHWTARPITLSNFTEFEKLPASEWPGKESQWAWDAMVYNDLSW